MDTISAFRIGDIDLVGKASRALAWREAGLLLVFQDEQLRFEGYSEVRAQTCQQSQGIGQNKNQEMPLPARKSPGQSLRMFRRACSTGIRRKHFRVKC